MIKDNRLHRLLGYIIKEYKQADGTMSVKYKFRPSELSRGLIRFWIFKPRTYETGYCLKILEKDKLIHHESHLKSGDIFWIITPEELLHCREAYFGQKYKEENAWFIAVSMSAIINAVLAVAVFLVPLLWPRDSDLHKLQLELLREKDGQLKESKAEIDSLKKSVESLTNQLKQKADSLNKK